MKDWYNIVEAAARLGFNPTTVRQLLKARLLGCRKVGPSGARYQITEAHIVAYLASCEVEVRPTKQSRAASPPAVKAKAEPRGRAGKVERLDGKPPKFY